MVADGRHTRAVRPLKPLPVTVDIIASRQERLVSGRQLDEAGVDADWRYRLVRQGRLIRVTRGVFDTDVVPASQRSGPGSLDHLRRRPAWVGLLAGGPGSTAVGLCALALYRVQGLPRTIRPEVVPPDGRWRRDRDGVTFRTVSTTAATRFAGDWQIASVIDALSLGIGQMCREDAVAVMDDLLRTRAATPVELAQAHDLARGHRGIQAAHPWWQLADGRAESPLESRARLACLDAGIGPDALQLDILGSGGAHLGRIDLAWLLPDGTWLLVEIDGAAVHGAPDAVYRDRARQNGLVTAGGSRLLRFTARDVRTSMAGELAALLRAAGWRPGRYPDDGKPVRLGVPATAPGRL